MGIPHMNSPNTVSGCEAAPVSVTAEITRTNSPVEPPVQMAEYGKRKVQQKWSARNSTQSSTLRTGTNLINQLPIHSVMSSVYDSFGHIDQ
jgi:hypothetical protein